MSDIPIRFLRGILKNFTKSQTSSISMVCSNLACETFCSSLSNGVLDADLSDFLNALTRSMIISSEGLLRLSSAQQRKITLSYLKKLIYPSI